jgi:hypothetical protein
VYIDALVPRDGDSWWDLAGDSWIPCGHNIIREAPEHFIEVINGLKLRQRVK